MNAPHVTLYVIGPEPKNKASYGDPLNRNPRKRSKNRMLGLKLWSGDPYDDQYGFLISEQTLKSIGLKVTIGEGTRKLDVDVAPLIEGTVPPQI